MIWVLMSRLVLACGFQLIFMGLAYHYGLWKPFTKWTTNSVCWHKNAIYQGRTLVSPYVGMARKQDGGSNGCISNYTTVTRLGVSVTHFEALFYHFRVLSLLTRPSKSPVSNAKIAKWQPVKTRFCCCCSSSFFFSSARLAL